MNEPVRLSAELESAALDVWLDFLGRNPRVREAEFEQLCGRRADLAPALRRLRAEAALPRAAETSAPDASRTLAEHLRRLREPLVRGARYRRLSVIARGGMGVVHRVWDVELDRALAMKVVPRDWLGVSGADAGSGAVARFLEEARVTGQLDHPGIVPVHEIGIDQEGELFFTMKLVEGRNLREIIELARDEEEGWNRTRVVGVLLKVCEAMAYAHSKGVIHRDLKPSNVMVGRFGEVYVMDWGVARVLARVDELRPPIASLRAGEDEALVTRAGGVLGTPAYMAPEQAGGDRARLCERTDVYALGAMLYHVLSGRVPFVDASEKVDSATLLARVQAGPPRKLLEIDARIPNELRAICEKAMARDLEQRYSNMLELAEELRAYLEGRVVHAQGSGRLLALVKWVRRNRGLAGALAAVLVVALGGALALWSWRATQADLKLLSRLHTPSSLIAESFDLWPATPGKLPAMNRWLEAAQTVQRDEPAFSAQLESLRALALPYDPESPLERKAWRFERERTERVPGVIAHYESERDRLLLEGGRTWEGQDLEQVLAQVELWHRVREERAARVWPRATWEFADATEQLLHDRLTQIRPEIEEIVGRDGVGMIERVRRGAEFASAVRRRSLEEPAAAWAEANASIRDPARCPRYEGLELSPQLGLVPIGRDPDSGLWEFAHLQSGEPARRGADGRLLLTPETGIVLVLLPAGGFHLGAQQESPARPNFDPYGQVNERPTQAITIDAFFLSKYEMTQAQWERWMGANPSHYRVETEPELCSSALHPVESVTWSASMQITRELGLTLPSEAQWEYAARAGTQSSWSSGSEPDAWVGYANVLDQRAIALGVGEAELRFPGILRDDGWAVHAPVGSFRANPFGLHDVHGNVAEWCRDSGNPTYPHNYYLGTGERKYDDQSSHPLRGGSYRLGALQARSAARNEVGERFVQRDAGLRPARTIER